MTSHAHDKVRKRSRAQLSPPSRTEQEGLSPETARVMGFSLNQFIAAAVAQPSPPSEGAPAVEDQL